MVRRRRFCTSSPSSPTALCMRVGRAPPSPRSPRSPNGRIGIKRIDLPKVDATEPFLAAKELPVPPLPASGSVSPASDESEPARASSPVKSLRKASGRRLKGSLSSLQSLAKREGELWGTQEERLSFDEDPRLDELRITLPRDSSSTGLTVRVESSLSSYEPAKSPSPISPLERATEEIREVVADQAEEMAPKRPAPLTPRTSSFSSHARSRSAAKGPPPPIIVPPSHSSKSTLDNVRMPSGPIIAHSLRRASDSSLAGLPPSTAGKFPLSRLRAPSPDELVLSASLRRASSSTATASTAGDAEHAVIGRAVSIMPGQELDYKRAEPDEEVVGVHSLPVSADPDGIHRSVSSVRSSTSTFDMDRLSFVLPPTVPAVTPVPSVESLKRADPVAETPKPAQPASAPATPRARTFDADPPTSTLTAETSTSMTGTTGSVNTATTLATSVPTTGLVTGQPLNSSSLAKIYLARSRRSASLTDLSRLPPTVATRAGARGRAGSADAGRQPRPLSTESMRQLAHAAFIPLPAETMTADEFASRPGSGMSGSSSSFGIDDQQEPLTFSWGAVDLVEAKRMLSAKELQQLVLETMNEYGAADHALVLEGYEELKGEVETRVEELDALQDRYAHELRQRSVLLRRHVSVLRAFNGEEGARFADALLGAVHRVDTLSRRLLLVTDHVGRVERLRAVHNRATASLGLAKLNAAYLRTKTRARTAEARAKAAEGERDALLARVGELEAMAAVVVLTPAETPLPLASFPPPPPQHRSLAVASPSEDEVRGKKRSLAMELADAEGKTVDLSRATQRHSIVSMYEDAPDDTVDDITEPLQPVEVLSSQSMSEGPPALLRVVAETDGVPADLSQLASALRRQIDLAQRALPPRPPPSTRASLHRRSASEPADSPLGIDDDDPFARRLPQYVAAPHHHHHQRQQQQSTSGTSTPLSSEEMMTGDEGWRRRAVALSNASLSQYALDALDVGRLLHH